jgi:hypothetical protein
MTAEGHMYFLDPETQHSQWEDPRIVRSEEGQVGSISQWSSSQNTNQEDERALNISQLSPNGFNSKPTANLRAIASSFQSRIDERARSREASNSGIHENKSLQSSYTREAFTAPSGLNLDSSREEAPNSDIDYGDKVDIDINSPQFYGYFTMLRKGVSLRTVRREMEEAGETKEVILRVVRMADEIKIAPSAITSPGAYSSDSFSTSRSSECSTKGQTANLNALKDDPILGKYAKMASVGVPRQSIIQKVTIDGVGEDQIRRMSLALGMEAPEKGSRDYATESEVDLKTLKDDPTLGKFVKMGLMGVPLGGVEAKMAMDGIDESNRERILLALGKKVGSHDYRTVGATNQSSVRRSSVPLQSIHWNTLDAEKLKKSIWASSPGDSSTLESIKESDLEEIEKLFKAKPLTSQGASLKPKTKKKDILQESLKLYALEPKRGQNVVIGLAKFKAFSDGMYKHLFEAVCSLDRDKKKLTPDHIEALKYLLPTPSEIKCLAAAQQSKHPAEIFAMKAIEYFPHLPKRLRCFSLVCSFAEDSSIVTAKSRQIIDSCNLILSSDKLAQILQKMLAIGNIMNQGTHRGQASGFTLDSLLKMVHTKGVDRKTTILDYVVKSTIDRGDEKLLDILDDLTILEQSVKLSGKDTMVEASNVNRNFEDMKSSLTETEEHIASSGYDPTLLPLSEHYVKNLRSELDTFEVIWEDSIRASEIMKRKVIEVVEYFGEDPTTTDTIDVFQVLQQFYRAIASAKEAFHK